MNRKHRHDGKPVVFGIYPIEEIIKRVMPVVRLFPEVECVWLFGSQAKRFRLRYDSDIDLIVKVQSGHSIHNLQYRLEGALEEATGKVVSVMFHESYIESGLKEDTDIERTKILIYKDMGVQKNDVFCRER